MQSGIWLTKLRRNMLPQWPNPKMEAVRSHETSVTIY